MAHGILRELINNGEIEAAVDSAGTGDWHIGESPDSRAAAVASDNGIDISDLRARQLQEDDFSEFDWIIVMDDKNYEDARKLAPSGTRAQLVRLTDYHPDPAINRVPDPYLEGGFDKVFDIIRTSIDRWLQKA